MRKFNSDALVYGLFGGDYNVAPEFQERLGNYLDDFYIFDLKRDARWKYYHGDQMISHWYLERGRHLVWDTIFIAQWDMLVIGKLEILFENLKPGELLFSGLRPVREVDPWWWHIREGSADRKVYFKFIDYVREVHNFQSDPLCGQFIVVCLPREFLDRYAKIQNPDLGFLEYKIPIYAQIYGTPFCMDHPYNPWWGDDPSTQNTQFWGRALNAEKKNVFLLVVSMHIIWPWGRRIFHPVFRNYPLDWRQRFDKIIVEIKDEAIKPWLQQFKRRYLGH